MSQQIRERGGHGEREAAGRLLLLCVRGDGPPDTQEMAGLLSRSSVMAVIELAEFHRVGGLAYERLRTLADTPAELLAALSDHYSAGVQHHIQTLRELKDLQPILDATGVAWAVVKGPAAVELLYRAPGGRPYRDLDLLAEPTGFPTVLAALEDAGARVLDRSWRMLRREMRGQLHLALPSGPLDLHWNLIDSNRGGMRIDTTELLERTVRLDLGGVTVPTLDPADSAVHLAVHASLSGGDRLGWLKDLERAAAVRPPNWEDVVDRARRWNVARPAGLLLSRAEVALGADIPRRVIEQLLGPRVARVVRAIDRRWPPERSSGGLAPARLVALVIGHGVVGGSVLILQRGVAHLGPRKRAVPSALPPGRDDADRDAFLRAVSAGGSHAP